MSRYRKIDPRIWNDQKFRQLTNNGKLVFFMLLTHPSMTALGAMRATLPGLAAEIGWAPEAFQKAFAEAHQKGMAEHDESACIVALPNFLRYNPPASPNVIKAWAGSVDLLPECNLKTIALQRAKGFAEGMSEAFPKAFAEAFPKALPKAMPNQEQEQEQEKEPPIVPNGDAAAVVDAYHRILPKCQHIAVLNPKRKKRIAAATKLARQIAKDQGWAWDPDSFWTAYFDECATDPWMRGDIPNPKSLTWVQNLDVLLAEDRFAGVMDRAIAAMRVEG